MCLSINLSAYLSIYLSIDVCVYIYIYARMYMSPQLDFSLLTALGSHFPNPLALNTHAHLKFQVAWVLKASRVLGRIIRLSS